MGMAAKPGENAFLSADHPSEISLGECFSINVMVVLYRQTIKTQAKSRSEKIEGNEDNPAFGVVLPLTMMVGAVVSNVSDFTSLRHSHARTDGRTVDAEKFLMLSGGLYLPDNPTIGDSIENVLDMIISGLLLGNEKGLTVISGILRLILHDKNRLYVVLGRSGWVPVSEPTPQTERPDESSLSTRLLITNKEMGVMSELHRG